MTMKRIFIIISLLSFACAAKDENDFYTEFKQKVTEALKYVDKGQFTAGLLVRIVAGFENVT